MSDFYVSAEIKLNAALSYLGDIHLPQDTCSGTRHFEQTQLVLGELAQGANPNALFSQNTPILCQAVNIGHVEIVQALLDCGADPNTHQDSKDLNTPPEHVLSLCLRKLAHAHSDWHIQKKQSHQDLPITVALASVQAHQNVLNILLQAGSIPPMIPNCLMVLFSRAWPCDGALETAINTLVQSGVDPRPCLKYIQKNKLRCPVMLEKLAHLSAQSDGEDILFDADIPIPDLPPTRKRM